ncbi:MAG TPA: glucosamine-6-phosphate synthase, partial [Actinomycetota bacterium]|nr:glucosamine-6-phosphate synthase [Actinomycetota bacterium]
MCGIVAILTRPPGRAAPAGAEVVEAVKRAVDGLGQASPVPSAGTIASAAADVESADALLTGVPGVLTLARDAEARTALEVHLGAIDAWIVEAETILDAAGGDASHLEETNASMLRLKDAVWAVRRDRLVTSARAAELAGRDASDAALAAFTSIQVALSAIDRLEVRGRDSAGVHVLVSGHGLDLDSPALRSLLETRAADPLFRSDAVRTPDGHLAFVYKAAAEIGELGDNTRSIRDAIVRDDLLHAAVSADGSRATVLGHTRWASVGIISEANAHPLNHEEEDRPDGPYVAAALNGDVDNHADLKASAGLCIPAEITTDAKVIPVLVSRRMSDGDELVEAFRRTVASFDGSVAIGAVSSGDPGRLLLALRGSGQALYVGFAEDMFLVASEPYGLVEQCRTYLRMDGEATKGQVVVLDAAAAGSVEGITRVAYDGGPLPVAPEELQASEVTTRDVDRGEFPHYLLKEVSESPRSFRKTLRGRLVDRDGEPSVVLGPETIPPDLAEALRSRTVHRVQVIGQGTAAVS